MLRELPRLALLALSAALSVVVALVVTGAIVSTVYAARIGAFTVRELVTYASRSVAAPGNARVRQRTPIREGQNARRDHPDRPRVLGVPVRVPRASDRKGGHRSIART